ncbi:MAG: hypothetical protein AAGF71_04365 [Pseudomonadota bacterium]
MLSREEIEAFADNHSDECGSAPAQSPARLASPVTGLQVASAMSRAQLAWYRNVQRSFFPGA